MQIAYVRFRPIADSGWSPHHRRMKTRRLLWASGVSLAFVWLFVAAPGMLLGVLWGGTVPVWPPVVSGTNSDYAVWLVTFGVAYGLPPISAALMYLGRSRRRG